MHTGIITQNEWFAFTYLGVHMYGKTINEKSNEFEREQRGIHVGV